MSEIDGRGKRISLSAMALKVPGYKWRPCKCICEMQERTQVIVKLIFDCWVACVLGYEAAVSSASLWLR